MSLIVLTSVSVWAFSRRPIGFSNIGQLAINTGTSMITFLKQGYERQ